MNLYKLMILYMLGKADYPITNARISDFMILNDYASYFSLQKVLAELTEQKLIQSETIRNSSFFELTEDGREMLSYFEDNINRTIREDIDLFLAENQTEIIRETTATADYEINKDGECILHLRLNEDKSPLLNLSVMLPSEEMAKAICYQWEEGYEEVYSEIFKLLQALGSPQ